MNESEQAQAIAEIQRYEHVDIGGPFTSYMSLEKSADGEWVEYEAHKAIVDSQAQKIEKLLAENNALSILVDELKADREAQAVRLEKVESLYAIARMQVEEQAKEIARLNDCMFQHMTSETYNHCQEYLEKMRGKNEKAN